MLDLGETAGTRLQPALIGAPAEVTGPRGDSLGVKPGLLVEGHEIGGVGGAEHVTAMATVVSAQEETERGATGGRVTAGRRRVGLMGQYAKGVRGDQVNSPSNDPESESQ